MSMLSAQCDELRAMAESVGLAIPQAATLMMGAADTIWELRCKCADLMSEREEYVWTREFMDRMAKHCGTKDCPSLVSYVEGLEDENARLREVVSDGEESARLILHESRALQAENDMLWDLVLDYEHCTMHADCSMCEYDGKLSTHCPLSPYFPDIDELRELGVEVDG